MYDLFTIKHRRVKGTFMQIKKEKINIHFNKKVTEKIDFTVLVVHEFSSLQDLQTRLKCWNETAKLLVNWMKPLNELKALNYKREQAGVLFDN